VWTALVVAVVSGYYPVRAGEKRSTGGWWPID
jgi:hypothetical protein